jgi:hypothetical protein
MSDKKMKRSRLAALVIFEFIATWLVFDLVYSSLIVEHTRPPRVANPIFHHAFLPNYHGFDIWAEHKYRLNTNNLGFKDSAVREVPLVPSTRRVLLIGDSFTEGLGLPFEDTACNSMNSSSFRTCRTCGTKLRSIFVPMKSQHIIVTA